VSALTFNDILIVDVDRSLCPVDTLAILRLRWRLKNWLNLKQLSIWRSISKQEEKIQLWNEAGFNCEPPTNTGVSTYVRTWKENGGYVAVVSGSSEGLARWASQSIDAYVDSVHGSTALENLTKGNKARFVQTTFQTNRRTYIGDSVDDLPVWEVCHAAVVIKSPRTERLAIVTLDQVIEYLPNTMSVFRLVAWAKLLCSRFPNN
jgi:phosphoserine phosphatase